MDTSELYALKNNIKQSIKESSALSKETHEVIAKKNGDFNRQLKKCNELKDCFVRYYREVLSEYNAQIDNKVHEKDLRALYTFIEGVRVHINLQQDDCNQLNYQIQRKQYQCSMIVSGVALFITFVFSVLAFLGINHPIKKTTPVQIECQCDSTKHVNNNLLKMSKEIL